MKVLLDECVDRRLAQDFADHAVSTVNQMGWDAKANGELLTLAEKHFEVFVTTDRNLSFQQNLKRYDISVVVLAGQTNRLADLRPIMPALRKALPFSRRAKFERSVSKHELGRPAMETPCQR